MRCAIARREVGRKGRTIGHVADFVAIQTLPIRLAAARVASEGRCRDAFDTRACDDLDDAVHRAAAMCDDGVALAVHREEMRRTFGGRRLAAGYVLDCVRSAEVLFGDLHTMALCDCLEFFLD